MILFFNVLVTPGDFIHRYNRGNLYTDDKVDVFKYSISSIAPIYDWSSVVIQYELDASYKHRRLEVDNYLKSLFPNQKNLSIRQGVRNTKQSHWQKTVEELNLLEDKIIFFSCNHDHVFTDNQTEYFDHCIDTFKKYENEHSVMMLSGYYESIEHLRMPYWIDGPLVGRKIPLSDSFMVITKSLLREWWCSSVNFGDAYLSRTDGIKKADESLMYNCFFMSRQAFNHYDGYQNVIYPGKFHYMEHCPPLVIPEGYFEGKASCKLADDIDKIKSSLSFYAGKGTKEYDYFYSQNQIFNDYSLGKRSDFRS